MTEREMLELAAKAAGYETSAYPPFLFVHDGSATREWNPLENDGDALRLAIDVGIEVGAIGSNNQVFVEARVNDIKIVQRIDGHKHAATRLAIVRAAIEIGRGM